MSEGNLSDVERERVGTRHRRLGMTRERIVDAAVELTREHGLTGWTQRQLTGTLDTSPSVVFHHVGDRDALSAAVVERVLTGVRTQGADTDWQEWFRAAWRELGPRLSAHRGTARWMLMHGPIFEGMLPFLDEAMETLVEAGFGDEAPTVYGLVFNTMTSIFVMTDDRALAESHSPGAMARAIAETAGDEPGRGTSALIGLLDRFDADADPALVHQEYVDYALDRLLDGLRLRLEEIAAHGEEPRT